MAPPVVTARVEVEFVPGSGVWQPIGSRAVSVTISRPRSEPESGTSVTTLTAVFKNHPWTAAGVGFGFCPFTPNNPAGAFYPNVEPERRIRVIVTSSAVDYTRFFGFIDKWTPEVSSGNVGQATVTVTASCVLSRYARKKVLSYYGETLLGLSNCDYWPFNDPADSATVNGRSGDPVNWPPRNGEIVQPNRPPGTAVLAAPSGGHLMDGEIEFTRGDDNTPAPVVLLTTRPGELINSVSASFRLSVDPAGSTGDTALAGYDKDGVRLWFWQATLTAGKIVWNLFDDAGVAKSFWDTQSPRDDAWHNWLILFNSATSTSIILAEKGGARKVLGSFAWSTDPRPVAYIVVGGLMVPRLKGRNSNTLQGSVSSVMVTYTSGGAVNVSEFCVPGVTSDADRVAAFLNAQGAALSALTGGASTSSTDPRQVAYTNNTSNLLDRWNEHASTVAGHLSTLPDGRRCYVRAEDCRPLTVALTLDAADDLDIPLGGWAQVAEEQPTRVTAVGPVGSVTVVDEVAEAELGMTLEGPTLQTSAGTVGLLQSAAARLMPPRVARLSQFGANLTTMTTDKVAAIMALRQTHRVRVDGLPSEYLGLTYQDVFAAGWVETYEGRGRLALFTFDTDPADAPAEGVLDDAEYGRTAMGDGVGTVTGGTCVGVTGTGTIIITSSSPASTTAGDYPVNLNWLGEKVTVTAPGGATSPQTFTVTARGVAPTVARVHAAGESIDVWNAATVAL